MAMAAGWGAPGGPGPGAWGGDPTAGWGSVFPWGDQWSGMPWQQEGWPQDPRGSAQAMQWMNTVMPWLQYQTQQQQWGGEFDWRKQMDEWSKGFQGEQFDWQKGGDVWSRGFQEQQLGQQKHLEDARRKTEERMGNVAAFGRRWRPNTRWM